MHGLLVEYNNISWSEFFWKIVTTTLPHLTRVQNGEDCMLTAHTLRACHPTSSLIIKVTLSNWFVVRQATGSSNRFVQLHFYQEECDHWQQSASVHCIEKLRIYLIIYHGDYVVYSHASHTWKHAINFEHIIHFGRQKYCVTVRGTCMTGHTGRECNNNSIRT